MKAIVRDGYGGPEILRPAEVDRPTPGPGEVLVRVRAASVNPADLYFLTGRPWVLRAMSGITRPRHRILGRDVAGVVEQVGTGVPTPQVGDEVFGEVEFGTFAEYVVAPADRFAPRPTRLGFAESAAVPLAGVTALQGLRDAGRLPPGGRFLVNGAAGGVGSFAVQIAKELGAEVTGVCRTDAVDLVRSLGADHVVDYTREDFTSQPSRYDVVFDLVGSHPIAACRRVLTPTGRYVASSGRISRVIRAVGSSAAHRRQVSVFVAKANAADLAALATLIEQGSVTPVVGRTYPLADTAAAVQHLAEGHARGKTVIEVATE